MSSLSVIHGIVARDLTRTSRQTGRLLGGIARPFMWLLLVGTGYSTIARLEGGLSYHAFVFPGIVVMAVLFGATLTAISTVYDREFGMLRLMLASPAGVPAVLTGRTLAASLVGMLQGGVVLAFAPLIIPVSLLQWVTAVGALALVSLVSALLGLVVAVRLRSVENFAGVINVVLFPLLFASGALYPTTGMPVGLRVLALANPVTYGVDLVRRALSQPAEFSAAVAAGVLCGTALLFFLVTALLFDPEQRLVSSRAKRGT
jgi:ABC-2 type transport system permease protein